jgi:hypothetical protein
MEPASLADSTIAMPRSQGVYETGWARQNQVNVRVRPTEVAIDESVDLAHEIFNRVFRKTYRRLEER